MITLKRASAVRRATRSFSAPPEFNKSGNQQAFWMGLGIVTVKSKLKTRESFGLLRLMLLTLELITPKIGKKVFFSCRVKF